MLILLSSRYPSAQQEEEKENIDIDDENFYKTDVILSFPLNNPADFHLKCKPSAIREKKRLTLDSKQAPITCVSRCFDAYVSKRYAKKYYAYNKDFSREEHKGCNCDWLILIKEKGNTCVRQSVSEEDVVKLTRRYQVSKNNKGFSRTIGTVRRYLRKVVEPFYLMIYKWTAGSRKAFIIPRHCNAQKVSTGPYFAKDLSLKEKVGDLLQSSASTDAIYNQLIKDTFKAVSESIPNPKFIDNRKYYLSQQEKEELSFQNDQR